MKSTTCRSPGPRPASTRAIACRTSPLACTSRSRCSKLRDASAPMKRPRYARGRLTFGAAAGMFFGAIHVRLLRAGACRSGVEGLRGAIANERFLLEAKALASLPHANNALQFAHTHG